MFFPESLYALSPRDEQVTWLDPRLATVTSAVASVSVSATDAVPDGRVLMLQSAVAQSAPGAAQFATRLTIQVVGPVNNVPAVLLKTDSVAKAANATSELSWEGSIIVPPGWTVRASCAYNAGAAVNTVVLNYCGILLPVANIQRV